MQDQDSIIWTEQLWKLSDLKPYDLNPRRISKIEFEKLVNDIKQLGYHDRVKINLDGTISSGHQRFKALEVLGYSEVPVLVPNRALTKKEFERVVIQGNLHRGEFDHDMLANYFDVSDLIEYGAPVEWFPAEEEVEVIEGEDDVIEPDTQKEAITQRGDVWILGNHRLMCGDSTVVTDVEKLMKGEKAALLFTDPPYGVSYADKNKALNAIGRGNRIQTKIENDHLSVDGMADLWYSCFTNALLATTNKASYYICSPQGGELMMMMMMMIEKAGWQLKHTLVWVKNNHVLGRCDYHYKHEPILYGWRQDGTHDWYGDSSQTSVWEIDKPLKSDLHPTMKPVSLVERALINSSQKEDIILDFFGGSGTTLIACEKTNRKCYMMELSPHYCDVIIQRWEKVTGKKAELEKVIGS